MDDSILLPVERAHQELSFDIYIYIYTSHPKCHLGPSGSHPSLCTIINKSPFGCAANKLIFRGGKSTKIFYSSKSTITIIKFYLSTSKSTSLKIYSSKSKK